MNVRIHPSWHQVLESEFQKPYFEQLVQTVKAAYAQHTVYPSGGHIFEAFNQTPFSEVSVVILGQDPYHGPGQAHGLCFSVPEQQKVPPSLVNIFKEIARDTGKPSSLSNGNLVPWAKQGVLLLNATLTVRANEAGSHQGIGWEQFTDAVIQALAKQRNGLVYLLWGSYAQKKAGFVNSTENLVLRAAHPSPLSAYNGFVGCAHFTKCNTYLRSRGLEEIIW